MAFSVTNKARITLGNKMAVVGNYNSASVTTGNIDTGLQVVEAVFLTPKGSAVTNMPVYNETLPLRANGGMVTIITGNGELGSFLIIGA